MFRRVRWGNVLYAVVMVILLCFFVWLGASYFDIVTHNLNEHPTYKVWNLFTLVAIIR